jgi:hypothetical protein
MTFCRYFATHKRASHLQGLRSIPRSHNAAESHYAPLLILYGTRFAGGLSGMEGRTNEKRDLKLEIFAAAYYLI